MYRPSNKYLDTVLTTCICSPEYKLMATQQHRPSIYFADASIFLYYRFLSFDITIRKAALISATIYKSVAIKLNFICRVIGHKYANTSCGILQKRCQQLPIR